MHAINAIRDVEASSAIGNLIREVENAAKHMRRLQDWNAQSNGMCDHDLAEMTKELAKVQSQLLQLTLASGALNKILF